MTTVVVLWNRMGYPTLLAILKVHGEMDPRVDFFQDFPSGPFVADCSGGVIQSYESRVRDVQLFVPTMAAIVIMLCCRPGTSSKVWQVTTP